MIYPTSMNVDFNLLKIIRDLLANEANVSNNEKKNTKIKSINQIENYYATYIF